VRVISIVIPAFNEEAFVGELLKRIKSVPTEKIGFRKEIIVVDDGSSDGTAEIARSFSDVTCVSQQNQGKGSAVQNGITLAGGEFVLVQDADLEYEPNDYLLLLNAADSAATAVYGSRLRGQIQQGRWHGKHPLQGVGPWVAGLILSVWTFLLYGKWITDTLTAYKLYPREFLEKTRAKTHGFETDHELTAKLIRGGYRIREVPIQYRPRTVEQGKKIRARDGLTAVWTLLKFRFVF
jgi:glycosyltransferase involved in cell wall biosynthesis